MRVPSHKNHPLAIRQKQEAPARSLAARGFRQAAKRTELARLALDLVVKPLAVCAVPKEKARAGRIPCTAAPRLKHSSSRVRSDSLPSDRIFKIVTCRTPFKVSRPSPASATQVRTQVAAKNSDTSVQAGLLCKLVQALVRVPLRNGTRIRLA
jgi:hypothetical protein